MTENTCRLREWRTENDFTLADVSDLVGIGVPALSRIERGERKPPAATKKRIARGLGVPIRELFRPEVEVTMSRRTYGRADLTTRA